MTPFFSRREFGLERFVPVSLMETMKRKELRKIIGHFLKMNQNMTTASGLGHKSLTSLQAKLYYLNIISQLPSYGAKCFSTNIRVSTTTSEESFHFKDNSDRMCVCASCRTPTWRL